MQLQMIYVMCFNRLEIGNSTNDKENSSEYLKNDKNNTV